MIAKLFAFLIVSIFSVHAVYGEPLSDNSQSKAKESEIADLKRQLAEAEAKLQETMKANAEKVEEMASTIESSEIPQPFEIELTSGEIYKSCRLLDYTDSNPDPDPFKITDPKISPEYVRFRISYQDGFTWISAMQVKRGMDELASSMARANYVDPEQNAIEQAKRVDAANRDIRAYNARRAKALNDQGSDEKSGIEAAMRRNAEKEWPGNYRMQEYTIKRLTEGYEEYQEFRSRGASGVPQETMKTIISEAEAEWGDKWNMVCYAINRQVEAYRKLNP